MSDFTKLSKAIAAQWALMSKGELYTVAADTDGLYVTYLDSFPEGTNPIYRTRTEHDCSCCSRFIRYLGNVVAIKDGKMVTVWDVTVDDPTYQVVVNAMAEYVRSFPVTGLFRTQEPSYGAESNLELLEGGKSHRWHHLHGKVAAKHYVDRNATDSAATIMGQYATNVGVFKRGMDEITKDAAYTVADLIRSNNLYRGEESAFVIGNFCGLQSKYRELKTNDERNLFVWTEVTQPGALIRNTAIGTLLQDLSAGVELEKAVKSFEDKVSGTNYKRPTALITPRMVEDAMKTIDEMGIEPALHRRLATVTDVSVANVLYVDNDVRSKMKGGVANLLMDAVVAPPVGKAVTKATDIGIDEFMKSILPKTSKMELLVSNAHQANFMTLTAPQYADSAKLFKWDNAFGWSYDGNITDSIKEKVKRAGGVTDAPLRISLAWFNHDDLDLHAFEPSGAQLYFGNRSRRSPNGGLLDVDMNCGYGTTREPVENIVWKSITDGDYKIKVNNYSKRETRDPGFTLELECNGAVHHYSAQSSPASGKDNHALQFTVKGGKLTAVTTGPGINGGAFSSEKWGITTEQFTRVDSLMLSPNHWDDNKTGNKHYFFILDGCKMDVPARGIYNEFLKPEFDKHRKVFEVLGNKMMCDPSPEQLSGVGYSSTRADKVVIRVNGHQLYNVSF